MATSLQIISGERANAMACCRSWSQHRRQFCLSVWKKAFKPA